MKDNYQKIKLDDMAEINSKQINKDFTYKDIRYIDIASVTKGTIDNIQNLKAADAPSRAKRLVKKNDILYSTVRPNLEHYVFIRDEVESNTVASTGFAVITPNEKVTDPYYLYSLLTLPQYTKYFSKIAEQSVSTYPTITPDVIEDLEFSLPPLPEQKRIANILSSFDNKIELLREQNKTLENIAQTIFKQWFIDFNFPDSNGKPYKDNGGKMIDSELGMTPEGWEVGTIGDITKITSGKGLPKSEYNEKGSYEVLGANGPIGNTDTPLINKMVIFTGRVGTLGNVFLSNKPAWYSDNTLIISTKETLIFYIYRFLKTKKLEKLDRGSTQPLITQKDLKSLRISLPDKQYLTNFTERSYKINHKLVINAEMISNLQKIKTVLLNKLIK